MDTKNYKTKDYHKLVWKESKKEVRSYYCRNVQDWGGDMIAALLTAIGFAFYLYFKDGESIDLLGIFISVLVGVIGVVFFRFIIASWNIPAKLYREKEIEADKFTWNDILVTVPDMPKDNPLPVCLIVFNNKSYDIEKTIVEVEDIKKGRIHIKFDKPLYLGWGDEEDGKWDNKTLCKDEKDGKIIAVANWLHENKGVYLLATNEQRIKNRNVDFIELEPNIQYTLQLIWHGEIENHKLDKHRSWYSLKYDDERIYLREIH